MGRLRYEAEQKLYQALVMLAITTEQVSYLGGIKSRQSEVK